MAERTGEFNDIDLDREEERPKPNEDEGFDEDEEDEGPLDPIDLDDDKDGDDDEDDEDDEDDDEEDFDEAEDSEDVARPESRVAAEDDSDVRDGIQRAAAVLKYIVENIVDDPHAISIGATSDDRGPVLLLRVAEDDRGKVIGRQGRIVQAIRTVVKAATVGTGERVSVEIID
jgi:predicted RNA-binding protein YlqC (UPF0109 family)